jgi:hypothetical protein
MKLIYASGMKGASRRAASTLGLVALALTSFLSTSPASSAEIEDELIKLPTEISASNTGVIFRNFIETFGESVLAARYPNQANGMFKSRPCSSMTDPKCDDSTSLFYTTYLPICTDSAAVDCIEKFVAKNKDGKEFPSGQDPIQPTPSYSVYKADSESNLIGPGSPTIFAIPGAEHGGGNRYALSVRVQGATPEGEHKPGQKFGKFVPQNINISIIPVDYVKSTQSGEYQKGRWVFDEAEQKSAFQKNPFSTCAIEEDSFCMNQRAFPADFTYQVVIRLRTSTNGWLYGRVQKPDVAITTIPGGEKWDLTAAPVRIPQIWEFVPLASMPKDFADWKAKNWESAPSSGLYDKTTSPHTEVRIPNPLNTGGVETAINWLNYWMPITGDKATAAPSTWSIRNLSPNEMNTASSCYDSNNPKYKEKRVTGIVTSNAMITSAGPPQFDAKEQSLIYQVAGPHFEKDGKSLFRGTYDLIMRKDVAQCLYNFTNAPIKASISVINANGEEIVATEQIAERNNASGEWITLGKYGFTFSSPRLRVKLTQEKVAAPAASPVQSNQPVAKSNKATITCIKGKINKKITGVNPKCPTGYRKK